MYLIQNHRLRFIVLSGSKNCLGSFHKSFLKTECKSDDKNKKIGNEKSSRICQNLENKFNSNRSDIKVAIIGGGMTPIYTSLLLKQCKLIKRINIADPNDELGSFVNDLSHIDTSTKIRYFGKTCISEALVNMDIIALMDEKDFNMGKTDALSQFTASSNYVEKMAHYMVQSCPSAIVAVFARPVTATLPFVSEIYKCFKKWNPNKIIGSIAIDTMRIESMTACLFDLNPSYLTVPIVGGADPCTVVPLLTKAKPVNQFTPEQEAKLIRQLRSADKELAISVNNYKGPSLSSGAAAAKFIKLLAAGLSGSSNVTCSAYVRSEVLPICRYFSSELLIGREGVEKNYGLPKVSPQAIDLIEQSVPHINELSERAIETARDVTSGK